MKKLFFLFFVAFKIYAQSTVTLAWDANEDTTVTGLKLYTSTDFFNLDSSVTEIPNTTTFNLNVETDQTYSAFITATNAAGLESEPSNTVRFTKFILTQRTNIFDFSDTITISETNNISEYPTNGIIYGEFPNITYVYTNSFVSAKDFFKVQSAVSTNTIDNYYLFTIAFTLPDPPTNLRTVE